MTTCVTHPMASLTTFWVAKGTTCQYGVSSSPRHPSPSVTHDNSTLIASFLLRRLSRRIREFGSLRRFGQLPQTVWFPPCFHPICTFDVHIDHLVLFILGYRLSVAIADSCSLCNMMSGQPLSPTFVRNYTN